MSNYKKGCIVKCKVSGTSGFGAFVDVDDNYKGMIHISEISADYVKDIGEYINIGDIVYAEIIDINNDNNQLKLTIKNMEYKTDPNEESKIIEHGSGFTVLSDNLDMWIDDKIKEIEGKK